VYRHPMREKMLRHWKEYSRLADENWFLLWRSRAETVKGMLHGHRCWRMRSWRASYLCLLELIPVEKSDFYLTFHYNPARIMIQDAATADDVYQSDHNAANVRKDSGVHSPTGMSYGECPTNICIMKGSNYEAYVPTFESRSWIPEPFLPLILERLPDGETQREEPTLHMVLKYNTARWVKKNFVLYKRASLSTFDTLRVQQQHRQYRIRAKHVHSPLRQVQASHAAQVAAAAASMPESC